MINIKEIMKDYTNSIHFLDKNYVYEQHTGMVQNKKTGDKIYLDLSLYDENLKYPDQRFNIIKIIKCYINAYLEVTNRKVIYEYDHFVEIKGYIELPNSLSKTEFNNLFLKFIRDNNCSFGGDINE